MRSQNFTATTALGMTLIAGSIFLSTVFLVTWSSRPIEQTVLASPIIIFPSPSPGIMQVEMVTMTPTNTPEPIAWQTATKEAELTATATTKPQPCPVMQAELDALPEGFLCRMPTFTPLPVPTSTPYGGCDPRHWTPEEICEIGAPFLPTPYATP